VFQLLRDLGERIQARDGLTELDQLAEDIGEGYKVGLAICFDQDGSFRGVRLTKGQEGILYRFGNPRGNDYTLVSKTSATTENVVPRLRRNAEKILDWGDEDDDTIQQLRACRETAEEVEDEIVDAVLEAYPEDASTDKRVFAYWAIEDDEGIHPFCGTQTVEEFLAYAVLDSYADRSAADVRMHEEDAVCSVCGSENVAVYGNFSDIACYNVDKQGFITGGFGYGQTTNNFPVCRSCILAVRSGKEYVEENLDFYMAGINYWLLPDAQDEAVYGELLEAIKKGNRHSLGQEAESLVADERKILAYIAQNFGDEEVRNRAWLNFFFYESSNAAWRIAGEVRRILPSRVQMLHEAKQALEGRDDLASLADDRYVFNLPRLRPFCGSFDSADERKLIRYIEAIFQGAELPRRTVIGDLVGGILDAQKDALGASGIGVSRYTTRDAWAVLLFLETIGSLSPKDGDPVTIDFDDDNSYTRYIEDHESFFHDPETVASFLTGCYVGQVLYAQYKENPDRDSQPFAKKFAGQKIDRERLKYLYNEGKEKLTHYDMLPIVQDLEPVLAEAWTNTGETWSLTDEGTTFAFNLGWTMAQNLATQTVPADTKVER
jgi:CRISPR-associated protein Csh1